MPSQSVVPGAATSPSPNPPPRPRWQRRRVWAAAAAGLVLVTGLAVVQRQRSAGNANLAPYTVLAESGNLPGVVSASGELEAEKRVNVSPKRQGVIEELFVEEGDPVRRGQALARMDRGDLGERLAELQAQLRSAQAQLVRSRSELERNERLYRQNAISLSDYNSVRSTFLVEQAAEQAARQRLAARRVEQADLIVRAPFDGVVTQRFADPGAFVTPTTTASATAGATSSSIVELAQGLEVVAKVPESDIGRVRLGQSATVRVDAFPDQRFEARVKRITPRAVKLNNVTSFDVVLRLVGDTAQLRIGMTADVGFQTGQVQADTLVPTVAIVTESGRPGVLLVGKNNQPNFQPVELGISSGKNTQILSGLKSGTRVFIDLPPWAKKRP
ncbi:MULTISPECIES: efflux RND transporter periplasmic adaptor subunit [unclassified Cyanobium]|uniref:efflux RND transporter periplasmic adaptor subunit n=1 Tax=unclassified Cyanobium TaxID=2627006 RepID=UPI0020CC5346|nr:MULTISPECIES: efflux RND transporter periplasmic adaptor subunit [unclassified Cyanobium]